MMIEDRLPDIIEMSKFLLSVEETLEKDVERIMEDNLEDAYFSIKDCIILLLTKDEEKGTKLAMKIWSELQDDIKELSLVKTP